MRILPNRIGYSGFGCSGIAEHIIPHEEEAPLPETLDGAQTSLPWIDMSGLCDMARLENIRYLCGINFDPFDTANGYFVDLLLAFDPCTPEYEALVSGKGVPGYLGPWAFIHWPAVEPNTAIGAGVSYSSSSWSRDPEMCPPNCPTLYPLFATSGDEVDGDTCEVCIEHLVWYVNWREGGMEEICGCSPPPGSSVPSSASPDVRDRHYNKPGVGAFVCKDTTQPGYVACWICCCCGETPSL